MNMNNRLPNLVRLSLLLCVFAIPVLRGNAQGTFTQVGPDTIFVDNSCMGLFIYGNTGATFVNPDSAFTFVFNPGLTGYNDTDMVPAGVTIDVTYVVTYPNSFDTLSYDIVVADTIPPTFDNIPNDTLLTCNEVVPLPVVVSASDLCDNSVDVQLLQQNGQTADGSCTDSDYTLLRIWTAMDDSGNTIVDTQTITVVDNFKPAYTTPRDTTIDCSMTDASFTGEVTMADVTDCNSGITIVYTDNAIIGACPQEQTIERTWSVTDACGNDSVSVQIITAIDTVAPTFIAMTNDTMLSCGTAFDVSAYGMPTNIMDNCDNAPTLTFDSTLVFVCADGFIQTNRWYVADACGNIDSVIVNVTVVDTIAPMIGAQAMDQTIDCATNFEISDAFNLWISNQAGATAGDNCDSDLTWSAFNSGTSNIANLPAATCPSPQPGVYRQQTVDFVVTDNCGNADTTTAVFTVRDLIAPVLDFCPTDTIIAAGGDCTADFSLIPPVIAEGCGSSINPESFPLSTQLFFWPFGSPVETTPVNPVTFNFSVSGPPAFAVDSADFNILLKNLDIEDPTEFFHILDEDGNVLGQTNNATVQCDSSLTFLKFGPDQINAWALDSVISFTFQPNIPAGMPGNASVNPICQGLGFVTVDFSYNTVVPLGLKYEYSVNGGPRIDPGSITTVQENFDFGNNEVQYFITDCAGNQDSCSFNIDVIDDTPPVLNCPPDVTLNLEPGECTFDYTLPFPQNTTDNCGVGTMTTLTAPASLADSLLTFAEQQDLNAFIAEDKTFTITGTGANVISMVDVTFTLQSDGGDAKSFYTLFDENGNALGIIAGSGCGTPTQVTFAVSSADYNSWANDGTVTFTAESNIPPVSGYMLGDGIVPCDPTVVQNDGDNDGTSFLAVSVSYSELSPTYYTEGATVIAPSQMEAPDYSPVESFNRGTTEVFYTIEDINGNADTCSYFITVEDNENPVALCGPTFVTINPSGTVTDTIFPAEIDLGSSDNCMIDTMFVFPNIVTCNSDTVNVTLTVIDEAGNQSTCETFVGITDEAPQPTYTVDCVNNTMQLFANPPAGAGGVSYTYVWSGPNSFVSFDENPFISNTDDSRAGFYTVEITGITGCSSEGVVEVLQSDLPPVTPDFFIVDDEVCTSESIVLTASSPPGSGTVDYQWYLESPTGDILLTTTNSPFHSFPSPTANGTYCYYVITTRNGCFSQASITKCVTVTESPVAMLAVDNITICEGEDFSLEAVLPVPGPGTTFEFIGPNIAQSGSAFQLNITNAALNDAGTYLLTAYRNGCPSNTVTASVFVNPVPAQPEITSNSPICVGDTLEVLTNIQNAGTYIWTGPDFTEYFTNEPILSLPNANTSNTYDGTWRVRVESPQGCESVNSVVTDVVVNTNPVISAAVQNAPLCDNENVELTVNAISGGVYTWSGPASFSAGIQNPTAPPVAGFYNVTVTDQNACSATDAVIVTLNESPDIVGVAASDNDCPTGPEDVTLKALLTDNTQDYDFMWTGDNFLSTDSCAVIENATIADNGSYQIVVTSMNGCTDTSAVQVTMGEIVSTPTPPVSSAGNNLCEGESLTLSSTVSVNNTDIIWYWITPTGTIPTSTPSLTIDPVVTANTGDYRVYTQIEDCFSDTSGVLVVTVNPSPVTTIECLNCPVCEGDDIMLTADCTLVGAEYEWTSDVGFNSSNCAPIIPNADEGLHEGTYTVRVRVDDCWSAPVSVFVSVSARPNNPQAVENGPYCVGSGPISLNVTTGSATPGATYNWFQIDQNGNSVPVGSTVSTTFNVPNSSSYTDGEYNFFVITDLGGCESLPSPEVTVSVSTIPNNQANAGEDSFVCEQEEIDLDADFPTVGEGLWSQLPNNPVGAEITNPDAANSSVTGLEAGNTYGFIWSLSNGACVDYSTDTTLVSINLVELAQVESTSIELCSVEEANLNGIAPSFGVGTWSQPTVQGSLGVVIVDENDPNTLVTGLVSGNTYEFTWTIPDNGCGGDEIDVLMQVSNDVASAGMDRDTCGFGCAIMTATEPQIGMGQWFSPDPNITFAAPNDPNTEACGLSEGPNTFIWILNDGNCGEVGIDSVIINYETAPNANDDLFDVGFAGVEDLDFIANDDISGDFFVNIIEAPDNGRIEEDSEGVFTYTANINFIGVDFITYDLCAPNCNCSRATVTLTVGSEAACEIPTIITPNNDGLNDAFVIPCLAEEDQFPDNSVEIYNQWGDEVYRAAPYTNDWSGTYNGQDLPAGTYFFVVNFGNNQKPENGFLIINR